MGRGVKLALTLIISATAFCARINAQAQDNLVLFWNLENFFDWTDGGNGDSDNPEENGIGPHANSIRNATRSPNPCSGYPTNTENFPTS